MNTMQATTPKFVREFLLLLLLVFLCEHMQLPSAAADGGEWKLLNANMGVSAMHMQLLNNDRVIIFDRTDAGVSNITLPNNRCRDNPEDRILTHDCTAHSVEYDVASNSVRPLFVYSDTWCSSGSAMADGSLTQTGGWSKNASIPNDDHGGYNTRIIKACTDLSCDWQEFNHALNNYRWYATNTLLPDNRQIIIGGTLVFTYEFLPKTAGVDDQAYDMPFLRETRTSDNPENNLYPFVFLNVDGNLFIFANNRAILFDYKTGKEVRRYPTIPGGDPRSYPSTGSAVMLPLSEEDDNVVEVLVCGGAPAESFAKATVNKTFVKGLNTCGRIRINDPDPQWEMETMPMARVFSDMVMLPNGNVLIINGGSAGVAGWDFGREPALTPLLYRPYNDAGSRFEEQNPTTTPRMYHSTAILLRDGRVLVAGNNPHEFYSFDTNVLYPTDLTAEAFSPDYMFADVRPAIVSPASQSKVGYGQKLVINFTAEEAIDTDSVSVTMVRPPFNTHSFSMNQRVLVLSSTVTPLGGANYQVEVGTPASGVIAPPGFYLLFVVQDEVPSEGIWIQIN